MARESDVVTAHSVPVQSGNGTTPGLAAIGTVTGGKVTVEGKVRVVEIRPVERNSVLAVEINDSTGNLTAMFYGRSHIPGLICGARVRFTGSARIRGGQPVMINPAYELVSHGEEA
jgi:RecG-like helicase